MAGLAACLDYAGVATFATGSAMLSRRNGLDLTATLLLACTAAIGGGTLRDPLIQQPVFWIADPLYVVACVAAATAVWFLGAGRRVGRAVASLEAIGIGCFAVVGAAKALAAGTDVLTSIILGVLTATFGGIVSDALAGQRTVVVRKDVYVTAALVAALLFNLLLAASGSRPVAVIVGAAGGIMLRLAAMRMRWLMPGPRGHR